MENVRRAVQRGGVIWLLLVGDHGHTATKMNEVAGRPCQLSLL